MLPAFCLAQTAGKATTAIQEGQVERSSVTRMRLYFARGLLCIECMERFEEDGSHVSKAAKITQC